MKERFQQWWERFIADDVNKVGVVIFIASLILLTITFSIMYGTY